MKRYLFFIFMILISSSFAQISKSANLITYFNKLINNIPGSTPKDIYKEPTIQQMDIWGRVLEDMLMGKYSDADKRADTLGYQVISFKDTQINPNKQYYILQKKENAANYWGTVVINPKPDRDNLFIQSPHPKFDTYTGKQGIYVFKKTGALAFYVSGAHRCNSSYPSECDGTTEICSGVDEAYRKSDQAHNVLSALQRSTEIFNSKISGLIVIQLHGFGSMEGDPDIIMSNGTRDTPNNDYISQLRDNLAKEDSKLKFELVHINKKWKKLTGQSNVQGRLLNGIKSPCNTPATVASGRFLHLEQGKLGLRNDVKGWDKIANAIIKTFKSNHN